MPGYQWLQGAPGVSCVNSAPGKSVDIRPARGGGQGAGRRGKEGEALWGKRWCEAQGGSRVDLKGKERRLGCEGKWQVEKKEKERGKGRKIGV